MRAPLRDSSTCIVRFDEIGLRINTVLPNPLASVVVLRSFSFIIHESGVQREPSSRLHKRISLTASAMRFFVLCALFALAVAQPAKNENWKNAMDEMVDRSRSECSQKSDEIACMKFKVFNLLDQIFSKDSFKVGINAGSGFSKRFTKLSYFYSSILVLYFIKIKIL